MRWLSQGEALVPMEDLRWLSTAELQRLEAMRFTKRRVEFLVSRWTAKLALASVEGMLDALAAGEAPEPAALASFEIAHTSRGAPVPCRDGAPLPRRISLTDRAGWAVCARSPSNAEVGCDLELVEARSDGFVADYFTESERALVASASSEYDRHRLANLVWSAKESALKVLHSGLRRDTRSVEVSLGEGDGDEWAPLVVRTLEGSTFPGWWRQFGPFLLTMAAEEPQEPPDALDGSPALAGAVPIHSWMAQPRR